MTCVAEEVAAEVTLAFSGRVRRFVRHSRADLSSVSSPTGRSGPSKRGTCKCRGDYFPLRDFRVTHEWRCCSDFTRLLAEEGAMMCQCGDGTRIAGIACRCGKLAPSTTGSTSVETILRTTLLASLTRQQPRQHTHRPRFLVGCSSPFTRLAQHLKALRAWCSNI